MFLQPELFRLSGHSARFQDHDLGAVRRDEAVGPSDSTEHCPPGQRGSSTRRKRQRPRRADRFDSVALRLQVRGSWSWKYCSCCQFGKFSDLQGCRHNSKMSLDQYERSPLRSILRHTRDNTDPAPTQPCPADDRLCCLWWRELSAHSSCTPLSQLCQSADLASG